MLAPNKLFRLEMPPEKAWVEQQQPASLEERWSVVPAVGSQEHRQLI